jgi:hypothetical protein
MIQKFGYGQAKHDCNPSNTFPLEGKIPFWEREGRRSKPWNAFQCHHSFRLPLELPWRSQRLPEGDQGLSLWPHHSPLALRGEAVRRADNEGPPSDR